MIGISILERCCQENVQEIGIDLVKELVGIPSLEYISKLVKAIFEKNEMEALEVIDEVIENGKDLNNFLWEVIKYIKDILIFKSSNSLSIYNKEELENIEKIAELSSKEKLLNTIYLLSDLENEIKWSSQKTIMFQVGIIKACNSIKTDGIEELRKRVEELENKLANGNFSVTNNTIKSEAKIVKKEVKQPEINNTPKTKGIEKVDNNSGNSEIDWANVISELRNTGKIRLFTSLANTKINQQGDMILEIIFPNGLTPFVKSLLEDSSNKKDLIDILVKQTGKDWHIKLVDGKNGENISKEISKTNSNPINDLGIDINVIE